MKYYFLLIPFALLAHRTAGQLRVDDQHPRFFNYRGQPTVLLGASDEDNLFQHSDFEGQLDSLAAAGGNYVRNSLSSRDPGNMWPYLKDEDGLYNLDTFNPDYFDRLDQFLNKASQLGIVVQVEVWATFDYYREPWLLNPWNPANTSSYNEERCGFPPVMDSHPTQRKNDFFRTVPSSPLVNPKVLGLQANWVRKVLSVTLQYDNVLYCMDNETSVPATWGAYWARFIKQEAQIHGKQVLCTEMWDPWNLDHPLHLETLAHPEIYDFVDVSQNNHNSGDFHWDNLMHTQDVMEKLDVVRPMTTVKTYGNTTGKYGSSQDGKDRVVRSILAGCASARFHRPGSGLGLCPESLQVISGLRSATDKVDFFTMNPQELSAIANRQEGSAYACSNAAGEWLIFLPAGGHVQLKWTGETPEVEFISLEGKAPVQAGAPSQKGSNLSLEAPDAGMWIAVLTKP